MSQDNVKQIQKHQPLTCYFTNRRVLVVTVDVIPASSEVRSQHGTILGATSTERTATIAWFIVLPVSVRHCGIVGRPDERAFDVDVCCVNVHLIQRRTYKRCRSKEKKIKQKL